MNAQHTPGPWTVDHDMTRLSVFCEENGWKVATVTRPTSRGEEGREEFSICCANARLIAAAPDLLEAAKLVIAWYESEDDHSKADFYERMQMCRDSEDALRAAIAKATNQQGNNHD